MEERMLEFFAVGSETMAAAQPVRGVSFLLEAGGAIYVEQLDDGSVEIRDELPGLKPSLV